MRSQAELSRKAGENYTKSETDRPVNVMVKSGKAWRIAEFGREEVMVIGEVDDVDELEGVDLGGKDDDEDRVGVVDETVPGCVEVMIWLECVDKEEEGTGIVDVNSGTGESNEPLIPSNEKIAENAVTGWEVSGELIEVNAI